MLRISRISCLYSRYSSAFTHLNGYYTHTRSTLYTIHYIRSPATEREMQLLDDIDSVAYKLLRDEHQSCVLRRVFITHLKFCADFIFYNKKLRVVYFFFVCLYIRLLCIWKEFKFLPK